MVELDIEYPIHENSEQFYNEAINDIANQIFLVPFQNEITGEDPDMAAVVQESSAIIEAICDVFDKTEEVVTDDINSIIQSLPVEEFQESLDARKAGLIH